MRRLVVPLVLLALGAAALPLAGCGGGDSALAQKVSAGRPATAGEGSGSGEGGTGGDASTEVFCARMVEFGSKDSVNVDEDPAAAAASAAELRELVSIAPEQVADDLEVFADLVDELVAMDKGGNGSGSAEDFGKIMSLFFDPKVIAAGQHLEEFLVSECGLDPSAAKGMFGGSTGEPGGTASGGAGSSTTAPSDSTDSTDLKLEDIDAIKDANKGAAWVAKVNSTTILNDEQVQLSASESDSSGSDSLTPDEAVAACEAVRTGLEGRQPKLTVEVTNGKTVVAKGAAGVPCTTV